MRSLRAHLPSVGAAAFLLAALLVFGKTDAAVTSTYEEDFSTIDWDTTGWSVVVDATAGTLTLPTVAGATWFPLDAFSGDMVSAIAFSPEYASDLTGFIGTDDGISRTRNAGGSWTKVLATSDSVTGIALSPAFGGDRTGYAITNGNGLWRTTDDGGTWQQLDGTANGFGIALSPSFASDRTVFVGAFDRILKSTDSGTTWTDISDGIDDDILVNGDIRDIAVDAGYASNTTAYVSTLGRGVYRTTNGGTTWEVANPVGITVPYATRIATHQSGRVAAVFLSGIYESTNRGASWSLAANVDDANDVAYGPDGALLIAREGGVFRVAAGGVTAVAGGWSGDAATVLDVASTSLPQGSVVAGHDVGAQMLRSGYAPTGMVRSPASGVDRSPFRLIRTTVTPTAVTPSGTMMTYEVSAHDGDPVWEGPVTPGAPWTFTTSGSTLQWRATLVSTSGIATPTLEHLAMTFELDDAFPPPTTTNATPMATAIRWHFTSTATGVTGFIAENAVGGAVVARTEDAAATTLEEVGLTPNTPYCNRRVFGLRDAVRSPASEPYACVVTLAAPAPAPQISEVTSASARLLLGRGTGNGDDVRYAIRDNRTTTYVAADGSVGHASETWQTFAQWADGDVTLIGLTPNTAYTLCVLTQNTSGAVTGCAAFAPMMTTSGGAARGDVQIGVASTAPQEVDVGGVIPVTMTLTQLGTGAATEVAVRVPLPSQGSSVAGSMTIGGAPLTDGLDSDVGDARMTMPDTLTFQSLTLGVGASATLGFSIRVTDATNGFLQIAPTLTYRPSVGVLPRTVAATPLTFDIIGPATPPPAEPVVPVVPPPPPIEPTAPPVEAPPTPEAPPAEVGTPQTAPPTVETPIPPVVTAPFQGILELTLTAPEQEAVIASDAVVVRGQATAGERVRVGLDDRSFWTVTPAADGEYVVTIRNLTVGQHRIAAALGPLTRGATITVAPPTETLAITAPVAGTATNALTVVVSGRGPANAQVTVALAGADIASATASAQGGFSTVLSGPLPEGEHRIAARTVTQSGAALEAGTVFTVDRTPPSPPTVRELRIAQQEPSTTQAESFDVTVELQGSIGADVFPTVEALLLTVESEPITVVFQPTAPEWSYRTSLALAPGTHTARVAARDAAGNVSPLPSQLTFTVAPAACGDGVDNDGDGQTDFPNDADCVSIFDKREATEGAIAQAVGIVAETTTATAQAVAGAADLTIKATAATAGRAAVIVQKQVLDNPTVEITTERVIAPAVIVAVATNTATAVRGFQFLAYAQYVVGLVFSPGRLFTRRKRKAWGTVYASLSKRPVDLATVRLLDRGGRVVQTEVTDHLGRYSFSAKRAGTYRIEVRHAKHTFPSQRLMGKTEDAMFTDLYLGAPFDVPEGGTFITKNIPVDEVEARASTDAQVVLRRYGRIVSGVVSDAGLVISIGAFAISPRPYVGGILAVNIIFYILFRRLAKRGQASRSWGAIVDAVTTAPLRLAVVRLFDVEFNKLLETVATDRDGRYRFLVGRNVYYVTAQKHGYEQGKSKTMDLTKAEGVVAERLALKPLAGAAHRGEKAKRGDGGTTRGAS